MPCGTESDCGRKGDGCDRRRRRAVERLSKVWCRSGQGFYRLVVRFGTAGYELRYRLDDGDVIVVRVFHTREDR
ncbi:MAG: type II toxin-antitoxin system RelE/ParE family toxin [Caulobacterales bacterium]|nr:type II toxin-antitoxin system RelE/ParE family toxin [Caulobacterales bacterium]